MKDRGSIKKYINKDPLIVAFKFSTIWEPLHNLFKYLDLLPYYPEEVIRSGRINLPKGEKVRLVQYPDPYPDMSNKAIKEVEV